MNRLPILRNGEPVMRSLQRVAVILFLAVPAVCTAQEGERLVWKGFDERLSKPYFQETRTLTTQVMKVMGADVKQRQDQLFVFRWTPHLPDRNQNWVVTQEIVR